MRIAHFFIDRPVFAWVLAIIVTLTGAFTITQLPLDQYPDIAPPTIQIAATYDGASAQTNQDAVVQVIEQQMVGLDNLMYMSSSANSQGSISIKLTFAAGTNPDTAQVQVQDQLQSANALLPSEVQQSGVTVRKASPDTFLVFNLVSEDGKMSKSAIADYLYSQLEEPIERLPGVGQAQQFGYQYAMHIWLDPNKLQKYALMPADIVSAINTQNVDIAAGEVGKTPSVKGQELDATITARSRLTTAEQFRNIVLKTQTNGSQVLLGDVARVALGPQEYTVESNFNNKPAAGLGLQLAIGANEVQVDKEVHDFLEKRASSFPAGLKVEYPYEMVPFIKTSIEEVVKTLLEAIVLVVAIMFLFLQNWRTTLIPAIAVPVVLLGTFGILDLFGYSINMMTMFGLVLAIGLLVDDAIVVVENVERLMSEEHLSPREATRKSMTEISSALVAIAMVLSAVLLPMAFFGGSTGIIYRQFSVSVVSAMALSVLVALTFTPALCATLLKEGHVKPKGWFFTRFNRGFDKTDHAYRRTVDKMLHHRKPAIIVYALLVIGGGLLFMHLPTSFLPLEDQGRLMVTVKAPVGATRERTEAIMQKVEDYLLKQPDITEVFNVAGYATGSNGQNVGMMWVKLKDWDQRSSANDSAESLVTKASRDLSRTIRDAKVFIFQPPTVRGMGVSSGFDMELVDQDNVGHTALAAARDKLIAQANQSGLVRQVRFNGLSDTPQLSLAIDDRKASAMGLNIGDVNATIEGALGSQYVDEFLDQERIKKVYVQGDAPFRMTPESLLQWYVRNASGTMVPFSAFATSHWTYGPPELDRYNAQSSFEIVGDPATGVSSGQAMQTMEQLVAQLPKGITSAWTGLSYQEQLSGGQAPYLYAVSVLFVFLCLAALYESWSVPLAVLLIVPLGVLGASLATSLRALSNDVYFQVGLLVTVGLASKNAILIVEFAVMLEREGKSTMKAIEQAVALRIRPIIMTSLAFLLGVAPLVVATGAGAAARHSIGTGVFGGTLVGTLLGIFFTPLSYFMVRKFSSKRSHPGGQGGDWSTRDADSNGGEA
ncbi:efflux RND transporter permease subunit [Caballeronia sp. LZ065]|uniref:efflux RND transporter permease subunit n=1 Tax=Caballeronia sp. LZ065 TaxID=3038571 RepID=UPI0028577985|nr:efflux RND transporter permease subunit [Caballeronia sp. LZ065]MDR5783836.1 efflux RND transporter permease subunit [Caballeronia sp. LZ065]